MNDTTPQTLKMQILALNFKLGRPAVQLLGYDGTITVWGGGQLYVYPSLPAVSLLHLCLCRASLCLCITLI